MLYWSKLTIRLKWPHGHLWLFSVKFWPFSTFVHTTSSFLPSFFSEASVGFFGFSFFLHSRIFFLTQFLTLTESNLLESLESLWLDQDGPSPCLLRHHRQRAGSRQDRHGGKLPKFRRKCAKIEKIDFWAFVGFLSIFEPWQPTLGVENGLWALVGHRYIVKLLKFRRKCAKIGKKNHFWAFFGFLSIFDVWQGILRLEMRLKCRLKDVTDLELVNYAQKWLKILFFLCSVSVVALSILNFKALQCETQLKRRVLFICRHAWSENYVIKV